MKEAAGLKLVVVEQNFILREKLANILSRNGKVGTVFQVSDPANLEPAVMAAEPDIVISDIGAAEGLAEIVNKLRRVFPRTVFCVYSDFMYSENQETVVREAALDLGADFFIDVVHVLDVVGGIINETSIKRTVNGVL